MTGLFIWGVVGNIFSDDSISVIYLDIFSRYYFFASGDIQLLCVMVRWLLIVVANGSLQFYAILWLGFQEY